MRQGCQQARQMHALVCGATLWCAAVVASVAWAAGDPAAVPSSPWTTGGALLSTAKPGEVNPSPTAAAPASVAVTQAHALPGTVIHGGTIPPGWVPQAVPYQAIGPDGRFVTMHFAPTYVFTYPIGPPVVAAPVARPASQVNRRQAYGQAGVAPGWNYQTQGAGPPAYVLPPAPVPTVARFQPQPFQFAPNPSAQAIQPPPSLPPATAAAPPLMPLAVAPVVLALTPPVAAQPVSSLPLQPAQRSANSHLWRVVGVHDGDTVTCLDESNQQQKVRLAEIDAPELGQDFGKVSRDALAAMVFGKTVEMVDDGKDRYGRWIGHLFVNGQDANRQMVATGNAWHYAAYSKDPSLSTLQAQAQSQQLGLWAQSNAQSSPLAPWDFRKAGKKSATGS